ncbi:U-scoloptoxin(01)-Cw1a-like [Periplaneta americana]|uniref:U-scoloptoxin(01)-Cw1a-like n=1 Tax=Periplaneta americana TaxID=6978 RepID=UPI0037E8D29D
MKMLCSRYALCAAALFVIFSISTSQDTAGSGDSVDYPIYNEVPDNLSFSCSDKVPGYYADPEAQCQVWHWCLPSGRKFSFLCPNGTVFNQNYRVCDWYYNVDCPAAPEKYDINNDLYKDKDGNPI